ncbi:segregation/condensation protein A [Lederbergia citrea]|uniref:Segregation and condensation protein A n=1 Tax=Lederbergia citrea TaxID=2833581 RepID=A0A942UKD7_9BACI|nr:segregation/condensation protein A [Lederbergia citrea]MBS4176462.1 segregation/condensation protein A [Lederbergia citrea]MBS4203023.1 segregation/condensation protein A [Lederbergia citrea]MBS4222305.1 segregation/condensation protein A [Lederbergia citrea]
MEYQVKIDAFEGPLDLLLHLINRLEIDIYDIPVAEISEQYLIYINAMTELELDGASEYLVMAATLLAIKSKMLLPKYDYDDEIEEHIYEEEDPRDELVEQLIEYKKFKEAAQALKQKEFERGQMYTKPPSDLSAYAESTHSLHVDFNVSIYDMLGAYHKLVRRKKLKKPISAKISNQEISIDDRMTEILHELRNNESRFSFYELFPNDDKQHIVITFLAVLELMKRNEIHVEQEGIFGEIFLTGRKESGAVG